MTSAVRVEASRPLMDMKREGGVAVGESDIAAGLFAEIAAENQVIDELIDELTVRAHKLRRIQLAKLELAGLPAEAIREAIRLRQAALEDVS